MMKLQGWVSGVIHIVIDNRYAGFIVISDEIKDDSLKAVQELKTIGIKKLVMLTGDSKPVSEKVYRNLGLDGVHAGLLPDHKLDKPEWSDLLLSFNLGYHTNNFIVHRSPSTPS